MKNLFTVILFAVFATLSKGQISILDNTFTYSQDFNGLANSGTPNWIDNSTIANWYSNRMAYTVGTGSSNSGAMYSFGASSASDRALGCLGSGTVVAIFGVRLKNDSPDDITEIAISYVGEQWRRGDGPANVLAFSYRVSNTAITSVTSGTWTNATSLNFTSPVTTTPNNVALDGNASANRVAISATLTVTVPAGSEIMLRWSDSNDTGNDDGISLDDFSIGSVTLPISLKSFKATKITTSTLLSFSTATELNNSHFSIERSADARNFTEIGRVQGAGTTRVPQSYTFTDEKPLSGTNYYRLRQVDFDGMESLSPVVSVVFGKSDHITIAPSPATDRVRIQLEEALTNDGKWQVFDNTGRQVLSGTWEAESAGYELDVNTLPEGMYTFRLAVGAQVQVKQFRKM